jgi:hypothetical protein
VQVGEGAGDAILAGDGRWTRTTTRFRESLALHGGRCRARAVRKWAMPDSSTAARGVTSVAAIAMAAVVGMRGAVSAMADGVTWGCLAADQAKLLSTNTGQTWKPQLHGGVGLRVLDQHTSLQQPPGFAGTALWAVNQHSYVMSPKMRYQCRHRLHHRAPLFSTLPGTLRRCCRQHHLPRNTAW